MTLGEAFSLMSSLYFRGKLAYARAVVERRGGAAAALVITPTRGLLAPNATASVALLEEFAATDIAAADTPLPPAARTRPRRPGAATGR